MHDPQIAAALRASSPDALAELFDAYSDNLFRYCWSMLRNREMAQVALRDTPAAAQAHIARLADRNRLARGFTRSPQRNAAGAGPSSS
jgi:hypothetical protein